MVVGAILMISTSSISPLEALQSIDWRVIGFLFGMLVLTAGFEKSGLIDYIVLTILRRSNGSNRLLAGIIVGSGLLSALLVNDTIALLWTPIVLGIGSKLSADEDKPLLMPLAFGVTVGSALTPIGNPQNLLVALNSGISRPFTAFLTFLLIPTLVSLGLLFLICRLVFRKFYRKLDSNIARKKENGILLREPSSAISDWKLARQSSTLMGLLIISFGIAEAFPVLGDFGINISSLALAFGILLLVISEKRSILLWGMSWGVLVFFVGMFVVMRTVWDSGIGSRLLGILPSPDPSERAQSVGSIMLVSILLSQILSNVPFVQLYAYNMHSIGIGPSNVVAWMALAAGSTLAGNLSLLGAVSNVIILDATESRRRKPFSFLEFSTVGSLVTFITALIFFFLLALGL